MSDTVEFTDRYQALGIPYPETGTMCQGECEGVGYVPVFPDEEEERWRALWLEADKVADVHKRGKSHIVKCPDCGGTGKRTPAPAAPGTSEGEPE